MGSRLREDDGVGGRLRDWMSLMESGPWVHASARTTGLADGSGIGCPLMESGPWIPAYAGMTGAGDCLGVDSRSSVRAVDSRLRGNDEWGAVAQVWA